MPKKQGNPGSRAHSEHFMIGQEEPDLGVDSKNGKLPLTRDVLKYFFFRKNLPENKFGPVGQSICCPLLRCKKVASCESQPDCQCVVRKIKTDGNWISSGIPIISDHAISNKIKALNADFIIINKHKNNPKSDTRKEQNLLLKLKVCLTSVQRVLRITSRGTG